MKALFSPYLSGIAPALKQVIAMLGGKYDYVSVLSTDSPGFSIRISQRAKAVAHQNVTTERGSVIRVHKGGLYSEYSFNRFDPAHPELTARQAEEAFEKQFGLLALTGTKPYDTAVLPDEPCRLFEEMETGELPEEADLGELVGQFSRLSDRGASLGENVLDVIVSGSSTHVNKLFLTKERDMRQSYVYSEGAIITLAMKEGRNKFGYKEFSGRKGPELFKEMDAELGKAVKSTEELLDAERVVPGEYDCVVSPEVSGLIAHEAFGHGVEMDMFVKGRALGAEYVGRRVGSDLVTMHEGAAADVQVASYAFDDEGTPAGDTVEIRKGILETGICDALAALRLGTKPTGNGKRQNFEHKVYTRMTNTIFDSGTDRVEDMIASIKHGYLLQGMESGMEDPKHWGIQCIIERGYEIADGKLTGKVVAPLVMTGYVPDLLGSISMLSADRRLFGSGGCGKGHKEWVKVSDGGPYMKVKVRLG